MTTDVETKAAVAQGEDARALQMRLYREIGLSAVAEALAVPRFESASVLESASAPMRARHTPATVLAEQEAA